MAGIATCPRIVLESKNPQNPRVEEPPSVIEVFVAVEYALTPSTYSIVPAAPHVIAKWCHIPTYLPGGPTAEFIIVALPLDT